MSGATVFVLRRRRNAVDSRELLEMAAALAVFALPVILVALAPPEDLLATDDPEVARLLDDLPRYGQVSLVTAAVTSRPGFEVLPDERLQMLLHQAATVVGA